jgi:hypothetical protein
VILITKPYKDITRKLYNFSYKKGDKSLQQNSSNPNPPTHKKVIYHDQMKAIPGTQGQINI